jgi:CubicO group peptidase (beta-lactamase class C family)
MLLFFLLPFFAIAQTSSLPTESQFFLDNLIENEMKAWNVYGASIVIIKGNNILYHKGFGYRDIQKKQKVTTKTLFEMGSSAKAFTGALLAKMDTDSIISLKKSVSSQYDISFPNEYLTDNITFQDLLTHQTGIPGHDFVWLTQQMTRDELLLKAKDFPTLKGLREDFLYNNIYYSIAGYVASKIKDKSWEKLIEETFLSPLGMTNTNFTLEETTKSDDFSAGFFYNGTFHVPIPIREIPLIAPAGYVFTNTEDLSKWVKMLLNEGQLDGKRILKEVTLRKMFSPYVVSIFPKRFEELHYVDYGLGWMVTNYRGNLHVLHGGNIDGFTSSIDLFPDKDLGIVILTNTATANNFIDVIKYEITDHLLQLDDIDWNKRFNEQSGKAANASKSQKPKEITNETSISVDETALMPMEGTYVQSVYGKIIITKNNDNSLNAAYGPFALKLLPTGKNTFTEQTMFKGQKFTFVSDNKDGIIGLKTEFPSSMTAIKFIKEKK